MMLIDQVNRQVKIEQVLKALKITPNERGFIHCPAHSDRSPSLKIYGDKGIRLKWKCFQCGSGGGPAEFLALAKKVSISRAAELLHEKFIGGRLIEVEKHVDSPVEIHARNGWERAFCSKWVEFIFAQKDLKLRAALHNAWMDYCLPYLVEHGSSFEVGDIGCHLDSFMFGLLEAYNGSDQPEGNAGVLSDSSREACSGKGAEEAICL